jgi:hypothetical protein
MRISPVARQRQIARRKHSPEVRPEQRRFASADDHGDDDGRLPRLPSRRAVSPTKFFLQYFPGTVLRQAFDEMNVLRKFVARQPAVQPALQIIG